MKKSKPVTTNAMRLLTQAGISFETSSYEVDEDDLSGTHGAEMLGIDPAVMFKTLVTRGERMGIQVFCIPVSEDLDLKKCAEVSGDKRVEMVHVKELLSLTGYVRGGCSPIGMKKAYPTFIDETAQLYGKIYVSAGMRGVQLILAPDDLARYTEAVFADLTRE